MIAQQASELLAVMSLISPAIFGHPVMPGVLIVEALAQTALLVSATLGDETEDKLSLQP